MNAFGFGLASNNRILNVMRVARNSVKVRRDFEIPNYAEKAAVLIRAICNGAV